MCVCVCVSCPLMPPSPCKQKHTHSASSKWLTSSAVRYRPAHGAHSSQQPAAAASRGLATRPGEVDRCAGGTHDHTYPKPTAPGARGNLGRSRVILLGAFNVADRRQCCQITHPLCPTLHETDTHSPAAPVCPCVCLSICGYCCCSVHAAPYPPPR